MEKGQMDKRMHLCEVSALPASLPTPRGVGTSNVRIKVSSMFQKPYRMKIRGVMTKPQLESSLKSKSDKGTGHTTAFHFIAHYITSRPSINMFTNHLQQRAEHLHMPGSG